MLHKMNSNRMQNLNCDCTITFGDRIARSHQLLLRLASPVLGDLIEACKADSNTKCVAIDINPITHSPDQFLNILNFIYTGNIEINNDNIFDIFRLATVLKIEYIVKFCCRTLAEVINTQNISTVFGVAQDLNHDYLTRICQSFCCFELFNMGHLHFHGITGSNQKAIFDDERLVLWNAERNCFLVGLDYILELCSTIRRFLSVTKQFDTLDQLDSLNDLRNYLNGVFEEIKISYESSTLYLNRFISNKSFAGMGIYSIL